MSGYVLGTLRIDDQTSLAEYQQKVPAVVAKYGGTFLAAGPVAAELEGEAAPEAAVVIRFDSVEQASRWYGSPEYREIRGLRHRGGHGSLILVEGLPS